MSPVEVRHARRRRFALICAVLVTALSATSPAHAANTDRTLAVIVPIVSDSTDAGTIDAIELAAATSSSGEWAILADSAIDVGATIALDSRIVASITALGDDAPPSASAWLSRVERSSPLVLPWGNADPFVLGSTVMGNRVSTIQLSKLSGVAAQDIVGWPTGRAGGERSVKRAESLGFERLIVDDRTIPGVSGTYSRSASTRLLDAVSPGATVDPVTVVSELFSGEWPAAIALPRNPANLDAMRAANFLNALRNSGVDITRYSPPLTSAMPTAVISAPPVDDIRSLMEQHRLDEHVAEIGVDPSVISRPRLERLCVVASRVAERGFGALVREFTREANTYEDVVSFQLGSDFTLLANQADVPFTVANSSATDVTVVVLVRAQTGIVHVSQPRHELTIPAGSSGQVSVPVRSVANGATSLIATLATADGVIISEPVTVPLDVQAQWESVTLVGFAVLVILIMGVGITRQVRDRRDGG